MRSFPLRPSASRSAFTLMEILLAVAIFAIGAGALFITFRTGVRASAAAHTASEVFQSARIAQDVIARDIANLYYRTFDAANTVLKDQLLQLSQRQQQITQAEGLKGDERANALAGIQGPGFSLDDIATPKDFGFHGGDNGQLDTFSFARAAASRTPDDIRYGGLRRVTYEVREGVLYREEASVVGLPEDVPAMVGIDPAIRDEVVARYNRDGDLPPEPVLDENGVPVNEEIAPVSEPLCEGVEIFNVSYGYFREDQWNEVATWDSNLFKYRFPPEDDLEEPAAGPAMNPVGGGVNPIGGGGTAAAGNQQMATVDGIPIPYVRHSDDLPGYVAIQLGLRDPDGKGKLRSFTFYFSLGAGQEEFDTSMADAPLDGVRPGARDDRGGPGGQRRERRGFRADGVAPEGSESRSRGRR